jgi:hypothetical protein
MPHPRTRRKAGGFSIVEIYSFSACPPGLKNSPPPKTLPQSGFASIPPPFAADLFNGRQRFSVG